MLKNITLSEVRLKRIIGANIKNLIDINSYKGIRHSMFLPVRGQRTRTNSGTRRSLRSNKNLNI
jgi:small subunit ribosomal protein S13